MRQRLPVSGAARSHQARFGEPICSVAAGSEAGLTRRQAVDGRSQTATALTNHAGSVIQVDRRMGPKSK